jgi:hypothetical protein
LFIFKHEFSKISVDLRTSLAIETHLAEGQWLEEKLTTEILCEHIQLSSRNIAHTNFENEVYSLGQGFVATGTRTRST